jgi:hypothetical protein
MKKILLSGLILGATLFTGCSSSIDSLNQGLMGWSFMPDNKEQIKSNIQIKSDNFKGFTQISTIPYAIIPENDGEQIPMKVLYRATIKDNIIISLQLYFIKNHSNIGLYNNDWGFYNEAYGEDGIKYKFIQIDRKVSINQNPMLYPNAIGSGVETTEDFAINLTLNKLKELSNKDYKIKIYGSRKEGVVKIPSHFSESLYDYVKDYKFFNGKSIENVAPKKEIKVLGMNY